MKEIEENLIAKSLKLSSFQRQLEIQRQEKKSMEVFFTLWKTNAKKLKKDQGLIDIVNPIGTYLNALDYYLK